ncbi:MAG: futalosine hydrolase [Deltaproteobacteria bacterium]|nr:futalosine hydrolase [Nannocystaceae bacterium]
MRVLWVHATAVEVSAVRWGHAEHLQVGVGKSSAAYELGAALVADAVDLVVAVGVAGLHRGADTRLAVGAIAIVSSERFADEGVATPSGFLDLTELGLGASTPMSADVAWLEDAVGYVVAPLLAGATVSTCSGTDALADERWRRTQAPLETMEGAAIAMVCQRMGVPWIGVRAISNFTGDRDRGQWDLGGAVSALGEAITPLVEQWSRR